MLMTAPLHARSIEGRPVAVAAPAGTLEGRAGDGVEGFVGIPYAAPPVGPLRWRPPEPAPRWQGVRVAAAFGNDCPQVRFPGDATPSTQPMDEDCLTLNLWRPEGAAAGSPGEGGAPRPRLPVMVWIHGGSFVAGSSNSPVLDGAALARRGVLLVSFNYRLGRFGFFAHPALTREAGGRPHANFAFLDMIAALQWVKANAAAFGGDPANVTIFGESAGGSAVNFLVASPMAEGLFDKAIVMSGANRERFARIDVDRPGRTSAQFAGVGFAAKAGLQQPDAAALRALPADKVQGGLAMWDLQGEIFAGPVIDGHSVVADPIERFSSVAVPRIPYIIGSTSAELSEESYAPVMMDLVRARSSNAAMALLERAYGDPPGFGLIDDFMFTEAARGYARIMAGHGAPAWRYIFDHVAEADRAGRKGAAHASELAYLFGNLPDSAGPSDRETARLMGDYFTNFAATGDPNGAGLPAWPRQAVGDPLLRFGATGAEAGSDASQARLDAVEQAATMRRAGE
ncbi:carboxylesterase/lipase family protein [Sphingomonas gilva]|nr:carboxylesterase family protein [Sphingomonas gilva]